MGEEHPDRTGQRAGVQREPGRPEASLQPQRRRTEGGRDVRILPNPHICSCPLQGRKVRRGDDWKEGNRGSSPVETLLTPQTVHQISPMGDVGSVTGPSSSSLSKHRKGSQMCVDTHGRAIKRVSKAELIWWGFSFKYPELWVFITTGVSVIVPEEFP